MTISTIDPGTPVQITLSSPATIEAGVALVTAANLTPAAGALGTDDITNDSGVGGSTCSAALDQLASNIGALDSDVIANASIIVTGVTVTDAIDALSGSITDFILPATSGAPVDTPADGTVRFDPATGILYAKATAGWVSVTLT